MTDKVHPKEIVAITYSRIPDPVLRRLIFGSSEIDFEDISVNSIAIIYRCLVVAWIFSFIVWKNEAMLGKSDNSKKNANALRIHRSFDSVYNSENVSLDLVLFTLTEMQLDAKNNRRSPYRDIIDDRVQDYSINQIRQLIRVWKHSYKLAEANLNTVMDYYLFVINLLPVLNSLQVLLEDGEVFFIHRGRKYSSMNIVRLVEDKSPYFFYLSSYTIRQNTVNLVYSDFIGSNLFEEDIPKADFFQNYNLTIGGGKVSAIFAQKLYSVDYKYIQNLALAISDALVDSTKERLFHYYIKTFPDAFKLLDFQSEPGKVCIADKEDVLFNSNWDNVIAYLMLESGPSAILEKIINCDEQKFILLAENLEIRFGSRIKADNLVDEYKRKQREESEIIRRISNDFFSLGEVVEKAQGNLMVQTIISAVNSLIESNRCYAYNAAYVETINMRIKNLESILKSGVSDEGKSIALNKAIEKTLRFLLSFYTGLIAYSEELNSVLDLHLITEASTVSLINNCELAFLKKAREKAQDSKRLSLGQLIGEFRELSKSISAMSDDRVRTVSKKGDILKSVIGRDYICDIKMFNELTEPTVATINKYKHYIAEDGTSYAVYDRDNLEKAKELLYFFIYNKDYQDEKRMKQLISLDPIYPYVVRYCIKSENRDGYHVNNYVVNMSSDDMDLEVKLLTEKNYEINELYYCIPNMNGTLPKWWIKPFLIKCRDVDEIFL